MLNKEFENPSEDFIRFILNCVYEGPKTQRVIEKFTPVVKKSFSSFVNEMVNDKISSALAKANDIEASEELVPMEEPVSKIITTQAEIEAYYIVKGILAEHVPVDHIVYRDTESYFGILYKDNNRKPICRLNLDKKTKQLWIPDENKNFTKYIIESLNDLYKYKNKLSSVVKRYME